jgi:hypothetical protein
MVLANINPRNKSDIVAGILQYFDLNFDHLFFPHYVTYFITTKVSIQGIKKVMTR